METKGRIELPEGEAPYIKISFPDRFAPVVEWTTCLGLIEMGIASRVLWAVCDENHKEDFRRQREHESSRIRI